VANLPSSDVHFCTIEAIQNRLDRLRLTVRYGLARFYGSPYYISTRTGVVCEEYFLGVVEGCRSRLFIVVEQVM